MRTLLLTLLLVGFGIKLLAQIRRIEYGWDTDKGHGQNTVVTINNAGPDADANLNISMKGLSNGYHLLFVRTGDARGRWSHTHLRLVNVLTGAFPAKIVRLDYTYTQSGTLVGQYAYTLPTPATSAQVNLPGDVSKLVAGQTYTLSIWATDENGTRSQVYSQAFTYRVVDCKNLTVAVQGADTFCKGGSTVLTATSTGGNTPVSFVWTRDGVEVGKTSSLTVTQAGTYRVQATDAQGCSVSDTKVITETLALPVSITGNNTFCAGSSTTLTASVSGGTTPFTYQWKQATTNVGTNSNTYAATTASSYGVEVSDSKGCKGISSSFAVTQRAAPATPTVTADKPAIVTGETATLRTTVAAGVLVQWLLNNNPIAGATQTTYTTTQAGTYGVRATNSEGCSANSQTVVISLITAIELPQPDADIQAVVSPNPGSGLFDVRLNSPRNKPIRVLLTVNDLTGRGLYQQQIEINGSHTERIDLSQQPVGLYLLNATVENQQIQLRLIKN